MDLNNLTGIEFENLVDLLLSKAGFSVSQTKASHDGGIDLIANSSQPFFKGNYIIQCKRYAGVVGEPIIRDLYGVVTNERANKGILITTGNFTNEAKKFAQGKNLELIGNLELVKLIQKFLPDFANARQNIIDNKYFMDDLNFDKDRYLFVKKKVIDLKNRNKEDFYNRYDAPEVKEIVNILTNALKNKQYLQHGLLEEIFEIEKIIPSQVYIKKYDQWSIRRKEILDLPLIYCLNNDFTYAVNELYDVKYAIKILYFANIYKGFNLKIISKYCKDNILTKDISVEDIKERIHVEYLDDLITNINWVIKNKLKRKLSNDTAIFYYK